MSLTTIESLLFANTATEWTPPGFHAFVSQNKIEINKMKGQKMKQDSNMTVLAQSHAKPAPKPEFPALCCVSGALEAQSG